ncbi:MAG TPA: efflux RND transporter permease subunit [Terriglobales bacterium]
MASFSLRHPYFIVVVCLIALVLGVSSVVRMPVDMFPPIDIPVVEVATFYNGMPPQQIEADITDTFERFFTLGSAIEHMESRSLPGVSLIRVYFQPGTSGDADVTSIANLAMADLKRLPQGTLPPVVLQVGASSLPVCLLTVEGKGLSETQLHDYLQYQIRDQVAGVPGATVPPPFGGKYRQIMVYTDPLKLQAHELSPMDVVRAVNSSNLILPAGDVRIGPLDYNIYTNAQVPNAKALNSIPVKTVGQDSVYLSDVGEAVDGSYTQYNIVRVDGQRSVYVPVMKQGGDTNTIAVVDGIRDAIKNLRDIPRQLGTHVVFDQSLFVKRAIKTVLHEGGMGLVLTGLMILLFLGSLRATSAVFLSIPLSVMVAFFCLYLGGKSINSMVLSGLALAFSRLIDNSVIVLENIYRHMEGGESPEVAAENGAHEVALPVLAITLATVVVFFPVTFLYGVSKFLFMALASGVVLSLFASYLVAITVVPLYCSRILKPILHHHQGESSESHLEELEAAPQPAKQPSWAERFHAAFNARFERMLDAYQASVQTALDHPRAVLWGLAAVFALSLAIYPFIGTAFFPKTDAGQFVINLKAPTGTRLEVTEQYVKKVEDIIRQTVLPGDLNTIVSNVGVMADFSALFTSNAAMHTAFVQAGLNPEHRISSFEYMNRVQQRIRDQIPELRTYFQSGSLVDAVLNQGVPAPIDVQVSGMDLNQDEDIAEGLARQFRTVPGVSDVYIPQDMDYPALQVNVNRERASELGLSPQEVIDNLITSLTSDIMIAPSYWVDPRSGNNYFVTVQYPDNQIKSISDLVTMPLHAPELNRPTYLNQVAQVTPILTPTEVDHYALERDVDIYVSPSGEDLGKPYKAIQKIVAGTKLPSTNFRVDIRGLVLTMESSFRSFGLGLILAIVLVYLILVAQFASFIDPFIILVAIPTGLIGVIITLFLTGTTLNIQSLMGVVMMTGMVVSNSILIVDFTRILREEGKTVREAVTAACRIRLRPILMTSLATIVGLLPMAFKLEVGSEAYTPLAWAIIGGVTFSVILTIFVLPPAYLLIYGKSDEPAPSGPVRA